jgi:hypothetical protein
MKNGAQGRRFSLPRRSADQTIDSAFSFCSFKRFSR